MSDDTYNRQFRQTAARHPEGERRMSHLIACYFLAFLGGWIAHDKYILYLRSGKKTERLRESGKDRNNG